MTHREYSELIGMLREAAAVIRSVPEDAAEKLKIRHFLPDELEGGAYILEESYRKELK